MQYCLYYMFYIDLLQSDYLNRNTDFFYLDHLSPIAENDFFSDDDGLSVSDFFMNYLLVI